MTGRLKTAEAAEILGVTERTLLRWRKEGTGPGYLRMEGRIYYTTKLLDEYLATLEVSR